MNLIYKEMKATGVVLLFTMIFLVSCGPSKSKQAGKINELENSLFSSATAMIDKEKTKELVDAYIAFADRYPDDTAAPVYLFKAGDISMNLLDPNIAITVFNRIINDYPDYEKVPHSLFLKGYVYENELRNLVQAQKIYNEFLSKYPDHEFADDVEISLQNLGKSPEELIQEFQEKSQGEATE